VTRDGPGGYAGGMTAPGEARARTPVPAGAPVERVLEAVSHSTRAAVVSVAAAATAAAAGVLPALMVRRIVDHALPGSRQGALVLLAAGMVAFAVLAATASAIRAYAATVVAQRVAADLRTRVYESVRRQSLGYFGDARAGDLTGMLTGGVDAAVSGVETASSHIASVFTLVATLIAMTMLSPLLTLVAVAMVPLLVLPARRLERVRTEAAGRDKERLAGLSGLAQEALGAPGAALAKTFGRDGHEGRRFAERARAVRDTAIADALASRWPAVARQGVAALAPAAVWLLGGRRLIDGTMTLGTVIAVTMLQVRLPGPAEQLLTVRADAAGSLARFDRIFEHLDLVPEVAERPGATALASVQGRITFEDVSLEARGGGGGLRGLSLEVPSRRMLAIVGTAGSGTSLIAPLVARLHDPDHGSVLLDGHDLRELSLAAIADAVAVIAREPFLFHATVRDNILYGRPDAPESYVAEAAKAARVHDFILTLPDGYDTIVGEGGHPLPAAETHLIAIARTLLKNPAVVLVDEPAGVFGAEDERYVVRALATLLKGRTVLIVARRPATVMAADQILVLDAGRIAERGTHDELIARGGLYARLYREQFATGPRLADVLA